MSKRNIFVPYLSHGVSFNEVPNRVSLFFYLGDCVKYCYGCHTPEAQQEIPYTPLSELEEIAEEYIGKGYVNTICVLGGTECRHFLHEDLIEMLKRLAEYAPVCLYSGSDDVQYIQDLALKGNCTYLKTGSYQASRGDLTHKTTNQRFFYHVESIGIDLNLNVTEIIHRWKDVTYRFWDRGKK